jgi:hypothetical protein
VRPVGDLETVLRRVRRHPTLPAAPPLAEIVTRARRRGARQAAGAAGLAAVLVVAASTLTTAGGGGGSGDGDGDDGGREQAVAADVSSRGPADPVLVPSLTEAPSTTGPTTTGPDTTTSAPTTAPEAAPTTAAAVPAAPTTTTPPAARDVALSSTIEDTDVGSGTGTIQYSGGSWTRCGGCDVATRNSSYYYGYVAGQSYTVTFRGVRLKVYAPDDLHGGAARVTVDGRPAATPTVSFLTSGTPAAGLRWDSGVLPDGLHRVVFTVQAVGEKVVLFDRADVYTG